VAACASESSPWRDPSYKRRCDLPVGNAIALLCVGQDEVADVLLNGFTANTQDDVIVHRLRGGPDERNPHDAQDALRMYYRRQRSSPGVVLEIVPHDDWKLQLFQTICSSGACCGHWRIRGHHIPPHCLRRHICKCHQCEEALPRRDFWTSLSPDVLRRRALRLAVRFLLYLRMSDELVDNVAHIYVRRSIYITVLCPSGEVFYDRVVLWGHWCKSIMLRTHTLPPPTTNVSIIFVCRPRLGFRKHCLASCCCGPCYFVFAAGYSVQMIKLAETS
jgi:hypothetical protein